MFSDYKKKDFNPCLKAFRLDWAWDQPRPYLKNYKALIPVPTLTLGLQELNTMFA